MLQSLLLSSLIGFGAVAGYEITINNINDFLEFSKEVNGGIFYRNATVLLETDLDFIGEFSKEFEPIGVNEAHCFPGVFDGQGHVISNLVMNSSFKYTGLFGYSVYGTFKNLVIDSTCSFTSSYVEYTSYTGSFLGGYGPSYSGREGILENLVNLGSVSTNGCSWDSRRIEAYIGGIAGDISNNYEHISIKNCVNYGPVKMTNTTSAVAIGGITGEIEGHILNCLNYGEITCDDSAAHLYAGGIAGYLVSGKIENCVSGGQISTTTSPRHLGSIVGYGRTYDYVSHCYWSEATHLNPWDLSELPAESSSFNSDLVLNETVSVGGYTGKSLLEALNAYSEENVTLEYSQWATNKGKAAVTFTVNDKKGITLDSQVILLPSLADGGKKWFDGWYSDKECSVRLETFTISGATELYGRFEENNRTHKIIFDTRGGSEVDGIEGEYGEVVELPMDVEKERHVFSYWETEIGKRITGEFSMPSYDVTLYAVWAPIHISNAEELVELSVVVNSGVSDYLGSTVYLDSDIEFSAELSKQFKPIGEKNSNEFYFRGTFDGQGHSIKGLAINTISADYVGLFGYSEGLTIKNVVIDESCSIVLDANRYFSNDIGGIIGKCYATKGACVIEGCTNKMDIACGGSYDYYLGGIAGYLDGKNFEARIENCSNYGDIGYSGTTSYRSIYISGILGGVDKHYYQQIERVHVKGCVNYGDISVEGKLKNCWINIDGIVGNDFYADVSECVNYGRITSVESHAEGSTIGVIIISVIAAFVVIGLIIAYISLVV